MRIVSRLARAGRAASSRLLNGRRPVLALASRFVNRRFVFAFALAAVAGSKLVHVYSHRSALAGTSFQAWVFSFFAQDIALLVLLRLGLEFGCFSGGAVLSLRFVASVLLALPIAFVCAIGVASITFFIVSGGEIHWSNIGVAGDAAGRALLLSGLISCALVVGAMCLAAWVLQDILFDLAGVFADVVTLPLVLASRGRLRRVRLRPQQSSYSRIPQQDIELGEKVKLEGWRESAKERWERAKERPWNTLSKLAVYAAAVGIMLAQLILSLMRPSGGALTFMSWTPALLPFVELGSSGAGPTELGSLSGAGGSRDLASATALGAAIPLPWLPREPIAGFEDWYDNKTHYSAAANPLRISNLGEDLLPELRQVLRDVPIRNIMLVVLESTRKDVFPLKEHGLIMQRLSESWGKQSMPEEAFAHLRSLTPTARYLTGDFDDAFVEAGPTRGGISFNDAYTASTYTLKSLTGLLCGISPLVADFNVEYQHHFYQPCLPHILDAFNTLDHAASDGFTAHGVRDNVTAHGAGHNLTAHGAGHNLTARGAGHNFTAYPWKSAFMQTATLQFDNFDGLMKKIGFPDDALIDKEYLIREDAKFGRVTLPDVNYFGFEETPLEDYIRDMFSSARKANERVFLTHVTSTSHHPWALPEGDKHEELAKGLDDLSHYLNTIGWDDRWLGKVLEILQDEGVANETLVIFAGDHGLSMPETDKVSAYYDPNVGNNHVPLVLSHPKMPPMAIDDAVMSHQVLPTVLDLLMETGSLSPAARQAAQDLVHNYEGQSLVRPMLKSDGQEPAAVGNWQFTVVNPGPAMVSVRDARRRTWRLVVPTRNNVEWRFSDLSNDPREANPLVSFDFHDFVLRVEMECGPEAAGWVREAAEVTRWWVEENSKRWRFGPYAAK